MLLLVTNFRLRILAATIQTPLCLSFTVSILFSFIFLSFRDSLLNLISYTTHFPFTHLNISSLMHSLFLQRRQRKRDEGSERLGEEQEMKSMCLLAKPTCDLGYNQIPVSCVPVAFISNKEEILKAFMFATLTLNNVFDFFFENFINMYGVF